MKVLERLWVVVLLATFASAGGCGSDGGGLVVGPDGEQLDGTTSLVDTVSSADGGAASDSTTGPDTSSGTDAADASVDADASADTAEPSDTASGQDTATNPNDGTASDQDTSASPDTASVSTAGCADGTREGFADLSAYPRIAGCGGAWDVPGIFNMPASCGRQAGEAGANPDGVGCTVTDLCAEGWSVCDGRDKVIQIAGGCDGAMVGATSPVFFTTQMSSTGAFECATGADATNDLFGCGDLGCNFTSNATVAALCAPLVLSSHDLCKGLRNDRGAGDWCNHLGKYPDLPNAWSCGSDGSNEALNVTKSHPDQQGGVLCCRD